MSTRWQTKRDTAANWTTNDPILLSGEWGYETDTGKYKIGDGSTVWTSLGYAGSGGSGGTGIISNPGPGEYRVKGIRIAADGKIVITYDSVAES